MTGGRGGPIRRKRSRIWGDAEPFLGGIRAFEKRSGSLRLRKARISPDSYNSSRVVSDGQAAKVSLVTRDVVFCGPMTSSWFLTMWCPPGGLSQALASPFRLPPGA